MASGSRRNRPSQRVIGHPVATRARCRYDRPAAVATTSAPDASATAAAKRRRSPSPTDPGAPDPTADATSSAVILMSASMRSSTARRLVTAVRIRSISTSTPSPVAPDRATTGTSSSPSLSRRPRRSVTHSTTSARVSRSIWLSTMTVTPWCDASGRRYRSCRAASAYFCGSRIHTNRSTISTRRSTVSRCAFWVESWSGRSSRTSPSRSSLSPESSTLSRATRLRGGKPSQSSSGITPCVPHTMANGSDVVGRRTPTTETSMPEMRLNSVDFPLPVAPASATTVCSTDSCRRSPARSTTTCTVSARSDGSRLPPAATASCSAVTRSGNVMRPRRDHLFMRRPPEPARR